MAFTTGESSEMADLSNKRTEFLVNSGSSKLDKPLNAFERQQIELLKAGSSKAATSTRVGVAAWANYHEPEDAQAKDLQDWSDGQQHRRNAIQQRLERAPPVNVQHPFFNVASANAFFDRAPKAPKAMLRSSKNSLSASQKQKLDMQLQEARLFNETVQRRKPEVSSMGQKPAVNLRSRSPPFPDGEQSSRLRAKKHLGHKSEPIAMKHEAAMPATEKLSKGQRARRKKRQAKELLLLEQRISGPPRSNPSNMGSAQHRRDRGFIKPSRPDALRLGTVQWTKKLVEEFEQQAGLQKTVMKKIVLPVAKTVCSSSAISPIALDNDNATMQSVFRWGPETLPFMLLRPDNENTVKQFKFDPSKTPTAFSRPSNKDTIGQSNFTFDVSKLPSIFTQSNNDNTAKQPMFTFDPSKTPSRRFTGPDDDTTIGQSNFTFDVSKIFSKPSREDNVAAAAGPSKSSPRKENTTPGEESIVTQSNATIKRSTEKQALPDPDSNLRLSLPSKYAPQSNAEDSDSQSSIEKLSRSMSAVTLGPRPVPMEMTFIRMSAPPSSHSADITSKAAEQIQEANPQVVAPHVTTSQPLMLRPIAFGLEASKYAPHSLGKQPQIENLRPFTTPEHTHHQELQAIKSATFSSPLKSRSKMDFDSPKSLQQQSPASREPKGQGPQVEDLRPFTRPEHTHYQELQAIQSATFSSPLKSRSKMDSDSPKSLQQQSPAIREPKGQGLEASIYAPNPDTKQDVLRYRHNN